MSPRSDSDLKKTIVSTRLLLQTAATTPRLDPILNLDQIPNTPLTWIGIFEISCRPEQQVISTWCAAEARGCHIPREDVDHMKPSHRRWWI